MMKEKRSIQKSIRISETVNKYVTDYVGENFNDKFENLVLFCRENESKIENKIANSKAELEMLNKRITEKQQLLTKLQRIENYLNYVIKEADEEIEK